MKTRKIDDADGPLRLNNVPRDEFIACIENMRMPDAQVLGGAGAIDLTVRDTRLNAATGTYAVTLADAANEGDEKVISFAPSGASDAVFNLTGTLWDWTGIQFDSTGRTAHLKFVGGKWDFMSGTARPLED